VVLDEVGRIGTRQLLDLLRLRKQHGFKLVLAGDDEQGQSIQAGSVIDLLRRALGEERIPKILTTTSDKFTRLGQRLLARSFSEVFGDDVLGSRPGMIRVSFPRTWRHLEAIG
jgi:AAA domain